MQQSREEKLRSYHLKKVKERSLQNQNHAAAPTSLQSEAGKPAPMQRSLLSQQQEENDDRFFKKEPLQIRNMVRSVVRTPSKSETAKVKDAEASQTETASEPSTQPLQIRSTSRPVDKAEMKKLFAARRRRAQIEMNAPPEIKRESKVTSIDSMRGLNDFKTAAATPDRSERGRREKERGRERVVDVKQRSSSNSSSNSRKALEMYLKKRGSADSAGGSVDSKSGGDGSTFSIQSSCQGMRREELSPVKEESEKKLTNVQQVEACDDGIIKQSDRKAANDVSANGGSSTQQSSDANNNSEKTVRFVSPLARRNPQCSPPRPRLVDHHAPAEQSAKDIEEEKEVVDKEEEDVDFLLFVAGLKREVAGDHTELWSGFQSLIGRPTEQHTPLYPTPAEEGEQPTEPTDKKKKRRVRMDPQTQSSLTLIHKTLANDEKVKTGFMKASSQLVNDKQVKKDRAEQKRMSDEKKLEMELSRSALVESLYGASSQTLSRSEHSQSNVSISSRETDKKEENITNSDPSKPRPTWINSYKKKKSLYLSAYASSNPKPSLSVSPSSSSNSSKHPSSNSSLKSSTSSMHKSVASGSSVKSKMPSWLETLKKKQKSLRLKQASSAEETDTPEQIVFQLSPRKKPKFTPPSSPVVAVAPWAHVQLRSTPKEHQRERIVPAAGKNNVNGEEVKKSDKADVNSVPQSEDPLPNLFSAGDIINLDALPPAAFASQEESATFPLLGSKWKEEQNPSKIVVVGKSVILTAHCLSGQDRKASVLWWCHRSEIRSLTLNVEATGANLALTNGRPSVPLSFSSADVCLSFAQFFLRGPSKLDVPKPEERVDELTISPSNDADVSVLTADEESLLDRYRQFSQSDRLKLKLTCLSPKGKQEVMDVALSPRVADQANAVDKTVPEKYRKMLQMGIPPGAVRHKMMTEGVDPEIVDLVTDSIDAPAANDERGSSLSDEEETIASKYRKMLKMMVPPEAVRHKMTTEGVDSKIIDAVLAPSPESGQESSSNQLTAEEEVIASKYRKMLKMRIPLDAVKHKMKADCIDIKIVSVIEREAAPDTEEDITPSIPKKKTKDDGPVLTEEEEKEASKYRMMIKVCIPKDAIRHDMKKEGVSDKIVEAVLGKEWLELKDAPQPVSKHKEVNRKTIQLHWTTSNLPPELLQQSIFAKADQKKRKISTINPEEADIKKLEELFQKRGNNNATMKKASSEETGGDMAKLLDLTRANNIAISLKQFNDFTFRSLAETIDDLDPDCKIVGERVQFIPNLLPTPKEIQAIKKFKGDDDKLITAELFFRQLVSIKRIEDKVKVLRTMHTFEDNVEETREGFKRIQEVCSQVLNSEKLIGILEMVLNIGNLMNEGTLNGGVEAFKFESLSKLSQTKSADGKMTVLDYIVETFIEKGERDALNLLSEFPDIQESSRLLIGDFISEMKTLHNDYNLCKTELTKMKNDQSSKRVTRSMAKKIDKESEVEDPRKALFAAIKARAPKEANEEAPKPMDPRQALFAAIKNRKNQDENDDDGSPPSNVEYSKGVQRLQEFLNHSKTVLSLADRDKDAAVRACKGLAVYCGEEGGERAAAPLLQIICEFATSIESAIKKYDVRVEAEKRKAAKLAKEKDKENRKATPTPKKLLKASSFQPHFGVADKVKVRSPMKHESSVSARQALFDAIKSKESKPKRKTAKPKRETSSTKQALLADIKSGKKPSQVKESRILLVNKMLQEAPANVKRDFVSGITYQDTEDPILRKIYEKESYSPKSSN